jgi:alpha-methylacyl-CoA racemase
MGPLSGFKVIEIKGIGPGPYAGMLLADMGAEVIVVDRAAKFSGITPPSELDIMSRGKRSIALDLKSKSGLETVLKLVEGADAIFEGFRPGVAERLGFGPEQCLLRNPKIVYGRMTGWGQTGPLAKSAGHDINYISLTGALAAIGAADKPLPPLNLVGDYAGGSLFLVMGMLAALLEAQKSAKGQVIDAAITDGSASLMSMFFTLKKLGVWNTQRQSNLLDGGAPFYGAYCTLDEKFVSLGAIEPQFFATLVDKAGLEPDMIDAHLDPARWAELKNALTELFKSKTRDQWCNLLEGSDACFAPVLDFTEAHQHPHNRARNTFIEINGSQQPAPAPRFSRTGCDIPSAPRKEGADTEAILSDLGFSVSAIDALLSGTK